MTHDELLNTLDDMAVHNSGYGYIFEALRAVVEYIKPSDWDFTDEKYNKLEIFKIIERHLR